MSEPKSTDNQVELKAGQLLVANSHMKYDPTFSEAVVLLLAHDERGSMGLIINKSIDELPYESIQQGIGFDVYAGKDENDKKAFIGGPMNPESAVFIIHDKDTGPSSSTQVADTDVAVSANMDDLKQTLPENVRVILGYGGWSQDQLESEIAMFQSWKVIDADPDLIFKTPVNDIYTKAAEKAGIDPNDTSVPKPPEFTI